MCFLVVELLEVVAGEWKDKVAQRAVGMGVEEREDVCMLLFADQCIR